MIMAITNTNRRSVSESKSDAEYAITVNKRTSKVPKHMKAQGRKFLTKRRERNLSLQWHIKEAKGL